MQDKPTILWLETEVEIDFGSTPVTEKTFTIVDSRIVSSYKVTVSPSGTAPTGLTSDAWFTDPMFLIAEAGTGQFTLYATTMSARRVIGPRKILYKVSAP